jgi:hypothetical protein
MIGIQLIYGIIVASVHHGEIPASRQRRAAVANVTHTEKNRVRIIRIRPNISENGSSDSSPTLEQNPAIPPLITESTNAITITAQYSLRVANPLNEKYFVILNSLS